MAAVPGRVAARVAREAQWLRSAGARVVLGDIPPLAFDAAAAAGVPSIALANFSWDWIYRHLAAAQPGAARGRGSRRPPPTRAAGCCCELPFAGDLSAFPAARAHPARGAPAARPSRRSAPAPAASTGPVVLVSFGGLGLPGFDPARARADAPSSRSWSCRRRRRPPANVRLVGPRETGAARARVRRPGGRRRRRGHEARLRDRVRRDRGRDADGLHRPRRLSRSTRSWSARWRAGWPAST